MGIEDVRSIAGLKEVTLEQATHHDTQEKVGTPGSGNSGNKTPISSRRDTLSSPAKILLENPSGNFLEVRLVVKLLLYSNNCIA